MTTAPPTRGDDIRAAFLRFFEGRGHLVMPSASLIPSGDPTLLLTSAGMVPFKPYFAGDEEPPRRRLASCQKCFRTTDIDSVGDLTHHTFFEMLGNFSIGDYFKRDAIRWAWEFVSGALRIPADRLWITVHDTDDEAEAIWRDEIGVPQARIRRLGDKDNFWGPAGDEGPCGPSSEIHYDRGEELGPGKRPGDDTDRFVEIWNLVFVQFYQHKDKSRTPLPAPSIDTGMGLERVTAIMQGVGSAYDTDLLRPVVAAAERASGKEYGSSVSRPDSESGSSEVVTQPDQDFALRVMAEHARSAVFLIADGVVPGNDGRGYVLRRVIRRGIRFAHKLGVNEPFLTKLAEAVIERMHRLYPELELRKRFVLRTLIAEEERFAEVYERGLQMLTSFVSDREAKQEIARKIGAMQPDLLAGRGTVKTKALRFVDDIRQYRDWPGGEIVELLANAIESEADHAGATESSLQELRDRFVQADWAGKITGYEAFILHDRHGFPLEMTQEIAREHGLEVDVEGFEREMEAQRERGRAGARFGADRDAHRTYGALVEDGTTFVGYEALEADTVIVGMLKDGQPVQRAARGDEVELVLRETPFYPEGGGQVGDTGVVRGPAGAARVRDTQRPVGNVIVHYATVTEGAIAVGDRARASVDAERRADIMRNHTATHMLHAALRKVLGTHVRQAGSLVAPDRLRFDFTHVAAMTPEELQAVERMVNEAIRRDLACHKGEGSYREVTAQGAVAFFGERYPERVRTLRIGPSTGSELAPNAIRGQAPSAGSGQAEGEPFSYEVCGGTHLEHTGQIGLFRIVGETGIGTGLRRIEAVTGRVAESWVADRIAVLDVLSSKLHVQPADLPARIDALLAEVEQARKASTQLQREARRQEAEDLLAQAVQVPSTSSEPAPSRSSGAALRDAKGQAFRLIAAQTAAADVDSMRDMGDWLRDKLGTGIVVLGAVVQGRPSVIAMVTEDLVAKGYDAREIVNAAGPIMDGRGGGRPALAQAGGKEQGKLGEALEAAAAAVRAKGR